MMNKMLRDMIMGLALYGLSVSGAHAVMMTFEGVAPAGGSIIPVTPYSEVGFTLTNSLGGDTDGIFDSAAPAVNTNGTDIFGWCAYCGDLTITLTMNGGGAFDFVSFDSAVLETGSNTLDVVGYFSGGGTATTQITQTENWTTQVLNYVGVTSVDFTFGPTHTVPLPDHAFDNLVMNVPEPTSVALMGIGLAGLAWARRRKRLAV